MIESTFYLEIKIRIFIQNSTWQKFDETHIDEVDFSVQVISKIKISIKF